MRSLILSILSISFLVINTTAQRPMGVNISDISNFGTQHVYVDVIKQSSGWLVTDMLQDNWDLNTIDPPLDTQGYPIQIPFVDAGTPYLVHLLMLSGQPSPWFYPNGNYTLEFTGTGTIQLAFDIDAGFMDFVNGGTYTVPVTVPTSTGINLTILSSDPTDPVRDIHFIMPGYENTYQTDPFHPAFLVLVENFSVARFMKPCSVEENPIVTWSDRTSPDFYTYHKDITGVVRPQMPYEHVAQICNQINQDAWISIPYAANDDFIVQLASYMHSNLVSDIYVEYSNETWNQSYPDTYNHMAQNGLTLGYDTDPWRAGQFYYVQRSIEIWQIFDSIYGVDAPKIHRIISCIPWDAIAVWIEEAFSNSTVNPTGYMPDAFAIAPYFGGEFVDDLVNLGLNCTWTVDEFIDSMEIALPIWMNDMVPGLKTIADNMGIPLIAYEGGQHLAAGGFAPMDPCSSNLVSAANRHVRMTDLYCDYFNYWFGTMNCDLFMSFVLSESYGMGGAFGIIESTFQDPLTSPKWNAHLTCGELFIDGELMSDESPFLFPNPTTGIVNLSVDFDRNSEVIVQNSLGQIIYTREYDGQIDLSHFDNGIYYITVITVDGVVEALKLILK